MLTVGTDTYITVADADDYINTHYRSGSKCRTLWTAQTPEDKEILLRDACMEIDALPLRGRKSLIGQTLAFPRLPYQYGGTVEVPQAVKSAQAELAAWMADAASEDAAQRRAELQAQGVTSVSIGDASESYAGATAQTSSVQSCRKAMTLLQPYVGGYRVC